jgi:pimeloyl-ACP methyl ester carboxylesterase
LIFVAVLLFVWFMLWLLRPGVAPPILSEAGGVLPGSISEKTFVSINGVRQGMFIRGKDRRNPVLLFLHGGPAMPEFAISQGYPSSIEDDFVVCWWEQRGSGISFDAGPTTEAQLVDDVIAVTHYLLTRFKVAKIHLLGHSAGSFVGIRTAQKAPDLYHAYIGVGQISRQMDSEKLAYVYIVELFTAAGESGMVARLRAIPLLAMTSMPAAYFGIRDKAMHQLGIGTTHAMRSVITGVFFPVMRSRAYSMREKIDLWRGKLSPGTMAMWNEILATDLPTLVPKLEIPVYFMSGVFDYTVSGVLAKVYLDDLEAPLRGF